MNKTNFINTVEEITMPQQMKEELLDNCKRKSRTKNILFRHSRLIATAAAIAALITVSIPAHAAYNLYRIKSITIFFEEDVTQEQIDAVGEALTNMEGIYSFKFTSAEEAWQRFSKEYLTEEQADSFTENPLSDSFNYQAIIKLSANTQEIRDEIEQMKGVRFTANSPELEELQEQYD